jgi:hypothetical protein
MATPSLLLIPDRYKAAKLYSQIPDSGAGDLTFARNSNATRVNSAGLIEKVRTNLALRSQSFATAAVWATSNGTITDNAGIAPDGTNTASKIVAINTDPYVYQSLTLTGQVTTSCFVKGIGSSIGKTASIRRGGDLTAFTLTADWQRVSVTATAAGAANYGIEAPDPAVIGDEILLWGFQVETGDIATDYIPTTTAAVSVGITADIPRLDYTGGGCPSLLLEPQRTNLALFSEQFTNAYWTQDGTVTANQATSPTGNLDADLVTITTSPSGFYRNGVIVTGGTYTASCFFKKNTANIARLQIYDDIAGSGATASLNLTTLVVTLSGLTATASVVDYGNGWVRLSITRTLAGSGWLFIQASGAVGESIYAWGAQVEAGSYATSYIPTLGSSVTRLADTASKTGISSLIGQTAGTVLLEAKIQKPISGNSDFLLVSNTANSSLGVYVLFMNTSGQIGYFSNPSGSFGNISGSDFSNQNIKLAYAYSSAGLTVYINGVQIFNDTGITLGSGFSGFELCNTTNQINAVANVVALYNTRLSNAELATLTAL